MKKRFYLPGRSAVRIGAFLLAAASVLFMACRQPTSGGGGGGEIAAAFTGVTAGGSATATTTKLTLTFDQAITDLAADDITLSGLSGVTKGALTPTGTPGVYELGIGGITATGTVTVTVEKSGYTISGSPKTVTVYYYVAPGAIAVTFINLIADGGAAAAATTKLTLTFNKAIDGLAASNITLSGPTGAKKGTLRGTGIGVYELAVSGITADGNVTVAVEKTGYTISPNSKTVPVFHYDDPDATVAAFTGLTADGSETATTTKLTLTFDQDITGLEADDITLDAGSTGAIPGELTSIGTGEYELAVSGITEGGSVTVTVEKTGYTISPNSKTAQVHYYVAPGTEKAITHFHIRTPVNAAGVVDEANKTIEVSVPYDTDVTAMTAEAVISAGASIDPDPTTARDYSDSGNPVKYTVTAEDGSTEEYTVTVVKAAADEKRINSFKIVDPVVVSGNINLEAPGPITVTVPYGTNVTAMKAEVELVGQSIDPDPEDAHNYESPVTYTVTANDGTSIQYTVTVSIAAITAIQVKTQPTKTSYTIGETFNSTGLEITASDSIGTTIPLSAASYTVSAPADFTTAAGTKTITVTHTASGKTATFTVTVLLNTVVFTGVIADGGDTATTTKLTLTFNKAITGLAVGDISLSGTTGAIPGDLTGDGTGVYELGIGGITASGTVTVSVTRTGYDISGNPKTASVFQYVDPGATAAAFTNLTADGSATTATTKLTLTFDKDITDLAVNDITLNAGSTGAAKGALTRTAAGVYQLAISGITASGSVTVAVAKSGYAIIPPSLNVTVMPSPKGDVNITLDIVDQGGSLTLSGAAPFTVYRTGTGGSANVSVTAAGYTYTWYVDSKSKGTASSITINAGDYDYGTHQLLLVVKHTASGVFWTAPAIAFTVAADH
ncbi:hypothetical protein FACS1894124_2630 [Spirochaetia bacterium]|nr:hypothetical protein FACS1894124_2630 [Spirochaetia bacterium]